MLAASPKITGLLQRIGRLQEMLAHPQPRKDGQQGVLEELGNLQNAYEVAGGYDLEHEAKAILSGLAISPG